MASRTKLSLIFGHRCILSRSKCFHKRIPVLTCNNKNNNNNNNSAANRHHCSFVMMNYETHLTRLNRKHIQAPLAAAIRSISDFGAQLIASWNELYLCDSPQHRH